MERRQRMAMERRIQQRSQRDDSRFILNSVVIPQTNLRCWRLGALPIRFLKFILIRNHKWNSGGGEAG